MSTLDSIIAAFAAPDRFVLPWMLGLLALVPLLLARRLGLGLSLRRNGDQGTGWLRRRRAALALPAAGVLAGADRSLRPRLAWVPWVLQLVGLSLLIVAGARPQKLMQVQSVSTDAVAIQLCIDRSSSMLEVVTMAGRTSSRLDAVKQIASEFVLGNGEDLGGRPGDLVGATVFAGFAETVCPPVREHDVLADMIGRIEPARRSLREDGTAIGDGLASAVARLVRVERAIAEIREEDDGENSLGGFRIKSKVVVLMTDGRSQQGISPIEAARLAAEHDVRVYAIGIGSDREQSGGLFSMLSSSALDDRLLRDIAEMTGGRFWFADNADTLRDVYRQIDALESTEIRAESDTIPRELYMPWATAALVLIGLERLLAGTVFGRTL